MPELSEDPAEIRQHGRLSPDYAQAGSSPRLDSSPPVGAAGRLGADYWDAVAELLNHPTAFFRVVMDESLGAYWPGWPDDPSGEARRAEGGYRLTVPADIEFMAIGAPIESSLRDVLVGATFRKLGGPAGGIYGLLLRDRGPGPRDGRNQAGRYYVAQVDDRGAVGIWRREQDRWIELVPWTRSDAVRAAESANDLSFEIVGGRLTLIVNGRTVASANDAVLDRGGVGLFVAGNGTDVLVERFVVHVLD
jgi:hypothetical protein